MKRVYTILLLSFLLISCKREQQVPTIKIPGDGSFIKINMGKSNVMIAYDEKKGIYYVSINDNFNMNSISYDNGSRCIMVTRDLNDKKISLVDLNEDFIPDTVITDYKNGNIYRARLDYRFSQLGEDTSPFIPLDKVIEEYRSKAYKKEGEK